MSALIENQPAASRQQRAFWLKHLHRWHWISSALCLIGMLLFAITGITLNHAAQIEAHPTVKKRDAHAPVPLLQSLKQITHADKGPVPLQLVAWLHSAMGIEAADREAEFSADEIYIALPRPGGDAWVSVALADGTTHYELTTRGWISYLNDLHKGRNTGKAWNWFLDAFAVSCLVFSLTGLFLLKLHAGGRVATWPLVGLGVVLPLVLALLFIH
ncbi:PepSY-associated TM helix domain-containing protein [Silvimonas amylolytica]|nr:PepSY-associated TM helix domain-containing protein [Silvimonas amylolytica]